MGVRAEIPARTRRRGTRTLETVSKEYPAVPLDAWVDPEAVFCALADGDRDVFWLDAGPTASAGWSFLGTGRREVHPDSVRDVALGGAGLGGDHVVPFRGGWVGWLSYEDAASRAGAPAADPDPVVPQGAWLRVDSFLAFDHATRRAWAVG